MFRTLTMTTLVAATATAALAQAQAPQGRVRTTTETRTTSTDTRKGPVSDPLFAAVAAAGGMAEVAISKIGVENATDPDLKKFSEKMIEEHTKANNELMALAAKKQIPLPKALDPKAQFCSESLAGLSGEDFDRCYAKAQLVAHMDAVAAFEAEATRGQDPDVKAWAAKTLPHIKEHLAMIKPHAMKAEKEKPSTEGAHSEK